MTGKKSRLSRRSFLGTAATFAEKHGMYAAFHVHQQFGEEGFSIDPYLEISPAVMIKR